MNITNNKELTMEEINKLADEQGVLPSDIIEEYCGTTFSDELLEEAYELKINPRGSF